MIYYQPYSQSASNKQLGDGNETDVYFVEVQLLHVILLFCSSY